MYIIEFEDLHWIIEAHHRLGEKYHTWLMVRWLKHCDINAMMLLMHIGMQLFSHDRGKKLAKHFYEKYNKSLEPTIKDSSLS